MTFANIQQISIRQNPVQRLLGIADVQVRTAGGGSSGGGSGHEMGESMHEAFFRGVDNAEEIRSAIASAVFLERSHGPDLPALRLEGQVTASVGVAAVAPGEGPGEDAGDAALSNWLIRRADEAMYEAKARGKDRVAVSAA